MNNNTSIHHPYIGDIDIDWEEEKRIQKEMNWERFEELNWMAEQDMLEYENRRFNEMLDDYEVWGNLD